MSRLNAGAFEFVPGRSFKTPTQPPPEPAPQPVQPSLPSLDSIGPPQTISLNIGGPKPTPPATPVSQKPQPQQIPPPKSQNPTPKTAASPAPSATTTELPPPSSNATSSKTFTLEKAKTDTTAIVNELHAVADQDTLKDLFGDGTFCRCLSPICLTSNYACSQGAPQHRLHWSRRRRKEHHWW